MKKKIKSILQKPSTHKAFSLTILMYAAPAIGVLLDNVLARYFGVGTVVDIFRLVTSFMLLGTGLVAGTLLKYVIIPELARYKAENNVRGGLAFVTVVTGIVLALILPLVMFGLWYPDWLLHLLGPGLPDTDGSKALVQIAVIGFALMICLGSFNAILQFYGIFWGQPAGQLVLNGGIVLGIILFTRQLMSTTEQLHLLASALTIGILGMVAVPTTMLGYLWWKELRKQSATNHSIQWRALFLAAIFGLAPQLAIISVEILKPFLINRTLSHLDSGSITLYSFGFKLLMLSNLPIRAVTTIIFPRMAINHVSGSYQKVLQNMRQATLGIVSSTVALACLLWFFSPYIIDVLFGLASLPPEKKAILNDLYQSFIFFSPFAAIGLLFSEIAYACKQTRVVVIYSAFNIAMLYIVLTFFGPYTQVVWVARAFVITQSLTMLGMGGVLYVRLSRSAGIQKAKAQV